MAYVGPFPLPVKAGGTGDLTLTVNGVLIGETTSAIVATAAGTNGQVLIGATGAAPAFASITAGSGITLTPGANSLTIAASGAGGTTSFVTGSGTATPASGVITITAGLNLFTSGATSVVTIGETQSLLANNYTGITSASSPYTVLSTDYYISANSTAGAISILLPNAPTTNRMFIVKDRLGTSATNAITVTTVGGSVLIDGATSFIIGVNYQAIDLVFNGTAYEIF